MSGVVPVLPRFKFFKNGNNPVSNGSVTVYLAGTSTLVNTYQDFDLQTLNTNPVNLDANGECLFWLSDANTYRFLVTAGLNGTGATVSDTDNIPSAGRGSTLSPKSFGAVGDGATDDTTALQAAINAAGSTRELDFLDLTYLCGELTFPNGIRWKGHGATLKCKASATATNNWIRAAGSQQGGTIDGIAFDYQTNANGKHILQLGDNARGWKVTNCTFRNMKTRAALRADWNTAVAGDGYITVRGCRFEGGSAAGATAFNAQLPGMGIRDITIADCDIVDCGSSLLAIAMINDTDDAGAGRFGAFIGTVVSGCRFVGNGTGTSGAIPAELWGHDNLTVTGCVADTATRGIGVAWCRNATLSGNTIRNQTLYAHEISVIDGLTITGESIQDCKQFVQDSSAVAARHSKNIVISGNTIKGTGLSGNSANTYAIGFAAAVAANFRDNIVITGNKFSDLKYISGVMRLIAGRNILVSGNEYVVNSEFEPFRFANLEGTDASFVGNSVVLNADYTANNPDSDNKPAVFTANANGVNVTVSRNRIISNVVNISGAGFIGLGVNAGAAAYTNLAFEQNVLTGKFTNWFQLNDSSNTASIRGNDTTRATETGASSPTVVFGQFANSYDGTASPVSGTWRHGDYVRNRLPAVGSPKGWICTVAGTPGTWVSEGNL